MPDWLKVYHRLPYPAKVVAAGARGRYLSRWRYGADVAAQVEEILARDTWTAAQWRAWTEERQAFVLQRAATQVPYYRDQWQRRRRDGDRAAWDVLANWPLLTKDALRDNPRAFVADDCDVATMFPEHTSGTTGKPLVVWLSRETIRTWFAYFEARSRRWYGVGRDDRWAIVGGKLVAPVERRKPPFWVWNGALHQLYLSAFHLAPDNIPAYVEAMKRHEISYLLGYPSGIHRIAQVMVERGLAPPPLKVVIANAEPLYEHQRRTIEAAFGCPVRETYGMAEIAAAAGECGAGRMHLWPDVGHVEVLADDDRPAPVGQTGRIVPTGLLNADMPLIRYDIGDRATLLPDNGCACGRALPLMSSVEGRHDDTIYTLNGRAIGRLTMVFDTDLPIYEGQIVQEDWDRIRVRVVPAPGYRRADGEALVGRIRDRVGPMEYVLEETDAIARTGNGKFREVLCLVDPETRPATEVRGQ